MSKYPVNLPVRITQADIDQAKCRDPNQCMIKLAVKRAIGGHGYVKVDATGVAITRRSDYREKAFLPRCALVGMLQFDKDKERVKPFSFLLKFMKTTRIRKYSEEQRDTQYKSRAVLASKGRPHRRGPSERIVGIAVTGL